MTAEELTHAQARKLANKFLDEVPAPGEPYGVIRDGCAMARHILSLPPDTDAQAQRIAELEAQLAARGPTKAEISYLLEVLAREGVTNDQGDYLRGKMADAVIALLASGALAAAQAVTLTEGDRKFVLRVAAFLRGQDFDEWPDKLIALFDRLTNGASTPAHPTEGEKL